MSEEEGKVDEIKGRLKEAAGAITDDDELRKEGHVDQVAGKIKKKAGELVDEAKRRLLGKDDGDEAAGKKGRTKAG